ncbi:glycosyltransferase family 2 protein [Pedobacter glucosidilyticus]|uniref:glycosyltransferase family 2 protein n=1 Tax=Pedobacter glucosidilyticus TaxID=1122941 RepID=UPI00041C9565|nr:glycosyltransferase family 2 protein [Pedobacter glucosidilyticus]
MISIIIPVYNSEKFIKETIDSIICQSYQNWECLIIDDHSQDNTLEIVEPYLNYKIKLIKNKGNGACAARNTGIEFSKGQYIKFLDSDDSLYYEHTLMEQINYLEKSNSDLVFGKEYYFIDTFQLTNLLKIRGGAIVSNKPSTFTKNFPITSNFLIKKKIISNHKWDEDLKHGQEFLLLFQLYILDYKFSFITCNHSCRIRIHNSVSRISNSSSFEKANSSLEVLKKLTSLISFKNESSLIKVIKYLILKDSMEAFNSKNHHAFKGIQSLLKNNIYKNELLDPFQEIIIIVSNYNPYIANKLYKAGKKLKLI